MNIGDFHPAEIYGAASRAVDAYLAEHGITHRELRDRAIDVVVWACVRHGIAEGTTDGLVERVVMEACKKRFHATDAEMRGA